MKNHIKIISVILCMILLISALPLTAFAAQADSGDPDETVPLLTLGQTYRFHAEDDSSTWFRFVPDKDMFAIFKIVSDTCISTTYSFDMLDSDMRTVESSAGTGDYNLLIVHYMLRANETYYFNVYNEVEDDFSLTVTFGGNATFDEATPDAVYPDMHVGDTQTVTIRYNDDVACINFVPERDMTIVFYSSGDYDTYGSVKSPRGSHGGDGGGEGMNFKVTERVYAGVTYTLTAGLYDPAAGSFDVTLEEYTAVWSYEDDYYYGGVTVTGYYGDDTDVVIPATIDERPVTSIGIDVFARTEHRDVESVVIPEGVRRLCSYAFEACYKLAEITFPDSLQEVDYNAFYMSKWYDDQPDGMVYVGRIAHKYKGDCPAEVTVRDGTAVIGRGAFSNCLNLTSIIVPESVAEIEYNAFYNCPDLLEAAILGNPYIDDNSYLGYYMYDEDKSRIYRKTDGFTLYGHSGSAAEAYANKNGFTFIAIKSGDADGDGEITPMDVSEVQYYLATRSTHADEKSLMFADVDGNGNLEIADVTYIQRYLVGMEIPFEIR